MKKKTVCRICSMGMIAALMLSGMTGCGKVTDAVNASEEVEELADVAVTGEGTAAYAGTAAVSQVTYDDMFTDRDLSGEYEEADCVKIALNGSSASCNENSVQIEGTTVTITEEGTYLISGTLDDGMILVDADDSAKVQLVLDGVQISNSENAAIYVRQADKVFLTLAAGSQNTLRSDGYTDIDDNDIDACVFSKCDLTVNGSGSLSVTANEGHGIVSKDDLKVTGGAVTVTAAEQGLSGKDSVRIADGTLQVTAGKDGIRSKNEDDTEKGFVYVAGGSLTVTAEGDGISASGFFQADNGSFSITAGGGSDNTTVKKDEDGDTVSTKGIKAGGQLVLNDGSYVLDCQDDSIHSNDSLTVNGGTFQLSSGDDGIHADEVNTIAGGNITISTCYEGIEGNEVVISGGSVSLYATDDGINAAGGRDSSGFGGFFGRDSFGSGSDSTILITGGEIYVNAAGDGIDSNGSLTMTGGEVYVSGPTDGSNGALDYDGTGQITGGSLVAVGASQMAMNFGDTSTQGSIMINTSTCQAGTEVVLKTEDGQELLSYTAESAFNNVVVSCPELQTGETYVISVGGEDTSVTLESLIYGSGSGMGGFGGGRGDMGGFGGGRGGKGGKGSDGSAGGNGADVPSGEVPQMPDGAEAPSGEVPQMPDGADAPSGEVPQMPDGGDAPSGEIPQMPDGGEAPSGEMPQMPDGAEAPSGEIPDSGADGRGGFGNGDHDDSHGEKTDDSHGGHDGNI